MGPRTMHVVTGRPGSGKTTLVSRVASSTPLRAGGFVTVEIRDGSRRAGFDIRTLSGESGVLARVGEGRPRVGKYVVDIASLERVGVRSLELALSDPRIELVVVDEVGKMEVLSPRFVTVMRRLLADPRPLLVTIPARSDHPLVEAIRGHPGAQVHELTRGNRDRLVTGITGALRGAG